MMFMSHFHQKKNQSMLSSYSVDQCKRQIKSVITLLGYTEAKQIIILYYQSLPSLLPLVVHMRCVCFGAFLISACSVVLVS